MKKTVWLLCFILVGCAKKPNQQQFAVKITGANSVKIAGIDYNILSNLNGDSLGLSQWQAILPVYKMPADTDMMDFVSPQPGKYKLIKDVLVFVADTPFQKNAKYFARYYKLHDDSNAWDLMKGKWKNGSPKYAEVIFTP
ncbi:hypothetical protein [Mucilaginibacter jinjuensis]|uniref:Lipoprotein n=1 Tax=Mucilaginibacter jinjuensis TaxID=1176721 RepID=A0ABY7T927_9SPHI|nr:hypothetical protein [Mucilaginibacter jinjuensis]WCT12396.1 hypothetical protein PQO05_00430 [Mucilaginibacter jinjuensis]